MSIPTFTPLEELASTPAAFEVTDQQSAEWALRKIAGKRAEIDLVKAQAAALIAGLQRDLDSFEARFVPQLEAWAAEQLTGGKSRTVKTLCGSLSFRTVPARLKMGDYADALTTASAAFPEVVQQMPVLDKVAFVEKAAAHFEATGELLPGIERTEERQSFSMKFATATEDESK